MAKITEMTPEQAKELIQTVESASDGYWFPLITVVSCFGIVIALLLYIWNKTQQANEKRHGENERLIGELVESKHTNDLILQRLDLIVTMHDEKIKAL